MNREKLILLFAGLTMGLFLGYFMGREMAEHNNQKLLNNLEAQRGGGAPEENFDMADHQQHFEDLLAEAEANPEDPKPLINLGNAYFDISQWETAKSWYAKALEKDDKNAEVWVDMGVCSHQLRDLAAAKQNFHQAMELDPELKQPYLNLAVVALDEDDSEDARSWLGKAADKFPEDARIPQAIAMSFLQQDKLEEAKKALRRSLELAPNDPEILFSAGRMLMDKDLTEEALVYFEKSTEADPDFAMGWLYQVQIYGMHQGDSEKALEILTKLEKLTPDDPFITNMKKRLQDKAAGKGPGAASGDMPPVTS